MTMKRFEVVLNIPSPYRLHCLAEIQRQLAERGIEFFAHFMSDMSRTKDAQAKIWSHPEIPFPHKYWPDHGRGTHFFNPGLVWHLRMHRPNYLLVGSVFDTLTGMTLSFLRAGKVPCAWCEGNTKTTGEMHGWKGWLKRRILAKFKYVAVPGIEGRRYIAAHQALTRLKMPEPVILPNIVDETRFRPRREWDQEQIDAVRARLGCDSATKLCVIPARLEWYKGLLELFSLLDTEMLKGWKILVMGSGSLKKRLLQLVAQRNLAQHFQQMDLIPYAEVPVYYAASDLFLLPSLMDRNPLSVVEALHSGLPVAVSELAGNVDEAVAPGKNGWILSVRNAEGMKETLSDIFSSPLEKLKEFGAYSRNVQAGFWNTHEAIKNFLDGIGCV